MWSLIAAIVLAEGLVSGWNIGRGPYISFYIDAARSMSQGGRALAFGAFDPGATITLDKLSGFLLPQVLSTWLFGFHRWSVLLPQVIEGMLTVLASYVVGARWMGPAVGLFAAAATATMPLLPSMFGRSSEDAMLTMALAFAFWCWQSAVLRGRLVPLMLSCGWVAVGFQAKMLQAWFIVPALAAGYLLVAPNPLAQRIRRGLLAAVVTIGLSLAWVTAIQLVPAADRPYIDGTTNNNIYSMVFGYNGLNRVIPNSLPGVIGDTAPGSTAPRTGVSHRVTIARRSSRPPGTPCALVAPDPVAGARHRFAARAALPPTTTQSSTPLSLICPQPSGGGPSASISTVKLFLPLYTTQVGWLYPLTGAGVVLGLWPAVVRFRRRKSGRSRGLTRVLPAPSVQQQSSAVPAVSTRAFEASTGTSLALLLWLLTDAVFISLVPIPHTSYLAAVTVQIAVLAAAGLVQTGRMWTRRTSRRGTLAAPILLVMQTGWTCVILVGSGVAPRLLLPTVSVLGAGTAAAVLINTQFSRTVRPLVIGCGCLAVLLGPVVWTSFNITTIAAGYGDAYGGPAQSGHYRDHPALGPGGQPFGVSDPFQVAPDLKLGSAASALAQYVQAHTRPGHPLMVTDSWGQAEPYILDSGLNVDSIGGYTGHAPTPTLQHLQQLIDNGGMTYFLLHDLGTAHSGDGIYLTPGPLHPPGMFDGTTALTIRDWVIRHCDPVPTASYEKAGLRLPGQTLYHCRPAAGSQHPPG